MNQVLTEAQELRQFAEERLEAHLTEINQHGNIEKEQRKRVFNQHLITFIDELNYKCREISGGDCEGGNKSLHGIIDEYQHKFLSRY
jgi:hypothetical protein